MPLPLSAHEKENNHGIPHPPDNSTPGCLGPKQFLNHNTGWRICPAFFAPSWRQWPCESPFHPAWARPMARLTRIKNKNRHAIRRAYGNRQIFFIGNIGIRVRDSLERWHAVPACYQEYHPHGSVYARIPAGCPPRNALCKYARWSGVKGLSKSARSKINRRVTGQGNDALILKKYFRRHQSNPWHWAPSTSRPRNLMAFFIVLNALDFSV